MKEDNFWNPVFLISLVVSVVIVGFGAIMPGTFGNITSASFDFLVGNFGWFYVLTMSSFVVFALVMLFSKYGDIKLGLPDDEPEYNLMSWFGMLFSAGMGVGLIFFGVAEPLFHYAGPLSGIAPESAAAADFAFRKSFLHWGLHPWAAYAIMALALAYMQFRRKESGLISSIFIPLIGREKATGPIGKTIDILAIFATVAGVASSLGMATMQINGGLNGLIGLPVNTGIQLAIIAIITFLFVLTAVLGIDKGIKVVSDMNIKLCFGLMIVAFLVGPKVDILNNLSNSVGLYLAGIVP
ncbi:MAG: BCCT family transporter, partial [Halanaerobium sp.]